MIKSISQKKLLTFLKKNVKLLSVELAARDPRLKPTCKKTLYNNYGSWEDWRSPGLVPILVLGGAQKY